MDFLVLLVEKQKGGFGGSGFGFGIAGVEVGLQRVLIGGLRPEQRY